MTLTEFLLARIEEDEAEIVIEHTVDGEWVEIVGRTAAECEAKRRIVAWCGEREQVQVGPRYCEGDAARESDFVPSGLAHPADSIVLRYLALPYADHEDYRQWWRP